MIFEKVKEIIMENLSVEEKDVLIGVDLEEDLNMDSLDAVELSMALEEEFDIKISDEELEKFKKVSDIVEYIEKCKK